MNRGRKLRHSLFKLLGHTRAVNCANFSPDRQSRRVVTASDDGTAIVWDLLDLERACELAGPVFDEAEQRRVLGEGEVAVGCDNVAP